MTISSKSHQGRNRKDRGKIERKLSEVNTRAVSREQNKWIGKFKMAEGNVISIHMRNFYLQQTAKRPQ